LKLLELVIGFRVFWSHPARGAWIEISEADAQKLRAAASHPARGAWIEMLMVSVAPLTLSVAPRTGCVD